MTPKFQLVPAAYVLFTRGGGPTLEVLLQKRGPSLPYMPAHWACAAAGHVEPGESVLAAAVRETREELGVGLDEDALVPLTAMHRTEAGNSAPVEQRVDFFFTAASWGGEPRIIEPDKCTELRWVLPSRPPTPMVPHEAQVLANLAAACRAEQTRSVPAVMTFGFTNPLPGSSFASTS